MGGVPKKVLVKLQSSFPSMFQFPVLPQPAGLGAAPEMKVLAVGEGLAGGAEPAVPWALSLQQYWLKEISLLVCSAYCCLSVVRSVLLLLWMKGVFLRSSTLLRLGIF